MTTTRKKVSPGIGQQLRAKGTTVMLGGAPVSLRVDWLAVEMLETQWGSIAAWGAELKKGSEGAMFRAVGDGVTACVRDLPVDARSLMDLARITEYAEALMVALIETGLWKEDDEGNPPGATTPPSPGNSSGTTTSSGGASTLNGSGA